ncbi:MAG: PHP domain-containing protein [Fibrobacteres bacterium]|nr:PHP domain-containing protein [Fibrobacterota bacterium]
MQKTDKCDLHIHTRFSDGTWSVEELLERIKSAGITLFSITDHDTVAGALAMEKLQKPEGMVYIRGVEFAGYRKDRVYHILGYGYDPDNRAIHDLAKANTAAAYIWYEAVIDFMSSRFSLIDMDEYRAYTHEPSRGGFKAVSYLMDKGVISHPSRFFPYGVESGATAPIPTVDKVIDIIKSAGGHSFLAHPAGYTGYGQFSTDDLNYWKEIGISGIECHHPSADAKTTDEMVRWCRKNKLMISGGSDCHGTFLEQRKLGFPHITADNLLFPYAVYL